MSDNDTPAFHRYRVERDGDDLVATSPSGTIQLRGRDVAELEQKRAELVREDLAALTQAFADFTPSGYPAPAAPSP